MNLQWNHCLQFSIHFHANQLMGGVFTYPSSNRKGSVPKVEKNVVIPVHNNAVAGKRVLLLHGWRTSGDILYMQTAAFRYHTDLSEVVKINAPWEASGPPDSGIAEFYPNRSYYEWWSYEKTNDVYTGYRGHEESLQHLENYLEEEGPFIGILGFSQGATLATLLAELQQRKRKSWFRFVILIGGVPPLPQYSTQEMIELPSLHLIGSLDERIDLCHELTKRYDPSVQKVITYEEGHNIPSIRTNIYPDVKIWIQHQVQLSQQ